MAATIGARIEVQGEQQYTSSIRKINQETKELKSEMELLVSSFDKSTTAEEQAAAKSELLARQIDNQQQKVDILTRKYNDEQTELERLKAEMEKATQEYGENSAEAAKATKEYNSFASQTSKTKTELNNAQASLNKMRGELEDTQNPTKQEGEAVKEMGQNFSEAGEKGLTFADILAANVASQAIIAGVKALGKAIADIGKSLVNTVTGTLDWADDLNTLSVKTGMSTSRLQEFEYMADLIDTDVETITGSLTKLVKNMSQAADGTGDAADAFGALGISVTDSNGELRNSEEVFNEVIDALGHVENETQRDAYAMSIFGKSARELNPLIAAGSEALAAYAQEAHDVGYVLDDDLLEPMNDAKDALDRMKRAAEGAKRQLVAAFAPRIADMLEQMLPNLQSMGNTLLNVLEPALKSIGNLMQNVGNAFNGLSEKGRQTAVNVGLIAAAIGPMVPALTQMLPLLKNMGTSLLSMGPAGAAIAGVAVAVGAMAAAVAASKAAIQEYAQESGRAAAAALALSQEQEEAIARTQAMAAALESSISATDSAASSMAFQRDRAMELVDELMNLADADGIVAESDLAHAQIIIDELNSAFGLEIQLIDGQIQGYDDLRESVYDVINAKTAEALLDRRRDDYLQALEDEAELEGAIVDRYDEMTEALEAYNAAQADESARREFFAQATGYDEMSEQVSNLVAAEAAATEETRRIYQERMAAYAQAQDGYTRAHNTIMNYESAQLAAQRGDTNEVIRLMTGRSQAWIDYGGAVDAGTAAALDAMYQEVLKAAQYAADVRTNWENGVDGYTESMVTEAENAFQSVLAQFDGAYTEATGIGQDFMAGLDNGLTSQLNQLKRTAQNVAGIIPHGMRDILNMHSPSRVAEDIGRLFDEGLELGLESGARSLLSTAGDQATALVGAYDGAADLISTGNGILAGNSSYNYGGFSIVVNGAPGQDEEELANIVMERMQAAVNRRGAVFA